MKISIAMTTYNGARYLQSQLDSFALQTRLPDELVVCDDCSSDETISIVEKFALHAPFEVRLFKNPKNLGYTKNFEKALSLCTGDLFFFSDQDDVWDDRKIALMLDKLNENPEKNVLICDARYVDENSASFDATVLEKVIHVGGKESNHIAGACTAITKLFRDFILPFPKSNCPAHDVYIHRWANLLNCKIVIREPLQTWRIHEQNISDNEMTRPELYSIFSRHKKFRNVDASKEYLKKAYEFQEMGRVINRNHDNSQTSSLGVSNEELWLGINHIIDAHMNRSRLSNLTLFKRWKLIMTMLIKGHYKHFQGVKSIAKDLIR